MSFQTPSDRFFAAARRFFTLESFDSPRLIRGVWIVALAYYGAAVIMVAFGGLRSLIGNSGSASTWQFVLEQSVTRLLQVVIVSVGYLLLIGIVLAACERAAMVGVQASNPSATRGLPLARALASSRSIRAVWFVMLAYYSLLVVLGLIGDIRGAAYVARAPAE